MNSFHEILEQAPARRLLLAPAAGDPVLPETLASELRQRGHTLTFLESSPESAVKEACQMLRAGEVDLLLQGDLPLERFLELLAAEDFLEPHPCFVSLFQDRVRDRLLLVADTYYQDFPDLEQKIACLRQVIALAGRLGIKKPKAAVLSAIETINPAIPSTVDAAVLAMMSQRGQFAALVDGPLSIDSLVDQAAAQIKGVHSPVPGDFDIILCPDIETGYTLSQAFTCIGGFPTAGVLLGTAYPVVIHPRLIPPDYKAVEVAVQALRGGDSRG